MFDFRTIVSKTDRTLSDALKIAPEDPKQRQLMMGALCILLLALGIVLWRDRDFWFPDTQEAESEQPVVTAPAAKSRAVEPPTEAARSILTLKPKYRAPQRAVSVRPREQTPPAPVPFSAPIPLAISARTVLPPLDVEVVAGDTHRTIRPGSSSVRVNLQPDMPAQTIDDPGTAADTETAANVTRNAAEQLLISSAASQIVTRPVRPNYPLLARQMKVQGSVIMEALIGRDGIIQNLRVVSGPRILASAAQDAVRQWHFKPHLEGSEPVETQAKITVNFTISTN